MRKKSIDSQQQLNEFKAQIVQLEEQVKSLSHKVFEERQEKEALSTKLFETQEMIVEKAQVIEKLQKQVAPSIESQIQEALAELSLERDFVKQSNGMYQYNNADVTLTFHDQKVMVKLGSGLIDIEEYIRLSLSVDLSTKKISNILEPRGQIPSHKRHHTSEVKSRTDHRLDTETNDSSCPSDSGYEFDALNTSGVDRRDSPSKRFLSSTLSSQNKFIKRVPTREKPRVSGTSVERKSVFRF